MQWVFSFSFRQFFLSFVATFPFYNPELDSLLRFIWGEAVKIDVKMRLLVYCHLDKSFSFVSVQVKILTLRAIYLPNSRAKSKVRVSMHLGGKSDQNLPCFFGQLILFLLITHDDRSQCT